MGVSCFVCLFCVGVFFVVLFGLRGRVSCDVVFVIVVCVLLSCCSFVCSVCLFVIVL